jgi:hypothetical protein
VAYGWYQFYMAVAVYDEAPKTFQETIDALPALQYGLNEGTAHVGWHAARIKVTIT